MLTPFDKRRDRHWEVESGVSFRMAASIRGATVTASLWLTAAGTEEGIDAANDDGKERCIGRMFGGMACWGPSSDGG
jgi:hypothetical protein